MPREIVDVATTAMNRGIYRNLNRKGVVWSVKNLSTGLIAELAYKVLIKNVLFKVSKPGQARVRLSKRKNVHAYVSGDTIDEEPSDILWTRAYYNPYTNDSFVSDGKPISTAKYARLDATGLWVVL